MKKIKKKTRRVTADEHGRMSIDGKMYRPVVGIVVSKWGDGTPKRLVMMRDEDNIELEGGEEFVVMLGSVAVFGEPGDAEEVRG